MFGRGKPAKPAPGGAPSAGAAPGTWTISRGVIEGHPIVTRFDTRAGAEAATRALRPIRVGIAVPFTDRLSATDHDVLGALEDRIIGVVGADAVLVGVITNPSMREFMLHAGRESWIPDAHDALRASFPALDVQMIATLDPDWQMYRRFVPAD